MQMCKYWVYYLVNDTDKPSLYAYTNDKDIKNLFESNRNMRYFVKEKKFYNREEIRNLIEYYQTEHLTVVYIDVYDKGRQKWIPGVPFALTEAEKLDIGNLAIQLNDKAVLYTNIKYNPKIFNDDIINALEVLGYMDLIRDFKDPGREYDTRIIADQFGILLRLYGKLMKGSD